MTSVRSFSALSGKERIGPDQARRFAGIVEAEATRTTRLLDDLLVLSGLRDGQVSIQRQEGFLDALIDRAVLSSGHEKRAQHNPGPRRRGDGGGRRTSTGWRGSSST
jgi:signal transduction histidine kinase